MCTEEAETVEFQIRKYVHLHLINNTMNAVDSKCSADCTVHFNPPTSPPWNPGFLHHKNTQVQHLNMNYL